MSFVVTIDVTAGALKLERVGQIEIHREEPLDERNESHDDEVHPYTVRVLSGRDARRKGEFTHRYGDGPFICVAKAMNAIGIAEPPRMSVDGSTKRVR